MRIKTLLLAAALGSISLDSRGQTGPSSRPAGDSPMSFMLAYDALAGSGPEAYLPMYDVHGESETRLAQGQARFDAEVGLFQRMVEQKWGHAGGVTVLHAMGLLTGEDIAAAKVVVTNDHAAVTCADGNRGPDLVHTAAGWKVDMTAFTKSLDTPVSAYLKKLRQLSRALPELADGLADGKYADADALVAEINRRFNTLDW